MKDLKRSILLVFIFFAFILKIYPDNWKVSSTNDYLRITDCIVRDIDKDSLDEIIISYFSYEGKYVDVFRVNNGNLKLSDRIKVPYYTVFFDIGDIDNDGVSDIVFLTSQGLYYRPVFNYLSQAKDELKLISWVRSEIAVPQPELLKDVHMVMDLNGDGRNEFIMENIRAIEIYETANFKKLASIDLQTILEYALIPGQFYPHYIFYTLPIIQIKDLDNDKKMEIITKFPSSINIYAQKSLSEWQVKNRLYIASDNVYFLSDAYIKFAFPVIEDIDNDKIKEIVISSANLDLPALRFEAIGNVYYFNKNNFTINRNKQILVKGIPLNLPYFFSISDPKYKDFILPVIPFNLISVFELFSGSGNVKVPFLYFKQNSNTFDINHPRKLFEIPVKVENITSFVEELSLDQPNTGEFPDFYYFTHNHNKKTVDIMRYFYNKEKDRYETEISKTLDIPKYRTEMPATLKIGHFTKNKKKDVVFITHSNLFMVTRE
jgi:hypothetical protein